jgi:hypothetical protein
MRTSTWFHKRMARLIGGAGRELYPRRRPIFSINHLKEGDFYANSAQDIPRSP